MNYTKDYIIVENYINDMVKMKRFVLERSSKYDHNDYKNRDVMIEEDLREFRKNLESNLLKTYTYQPKKYDHNEFCKAIETALSKERQ